MRYLELAELYARLEKTQKRLAKTDLISGMIRKTPAAELPELMLLLEGKVFPAWEDKKIGVASRLVMKAICTATGEPASSVENLLKMTGDLGTAARELLKKKQQQTLGRKDLSVTKVMSNLRKLADLQGEGSAGQKVQLVAELLTSATPDEGLYIVRTVLEDLRVGAGEGSIRDAIVWALFSKELGLIYDEGKNEIILPNDSRDAYDRYIAAVDDAYSISNDFGAVAVNLLENGIDSKATISPGKPLQAMLFQKAADIDDAFQIVGKPAALEYKYDGFRVQIHRKDDSIRLFTRRLEEVTEQFPDVVKVAKEHLKGKSYILDAEVVGIKPNGSAYMPFQSISQRIRRKHDIRKMAQLFPVEVNVFDVLFHEGRSQMNRPFSERRSLLLSIIDPVPKKIVPSRLILSDNKEEAMRFYNEALDMGNEGIMAKKLDAVYKPGKRVGYGVKIKPVMDSLDLVIVGAEWGEGKRASFLTSYILACDSSDGLVEVGRVSTGLKELDDEGTSFRQMTEILQPLIVEDKGKIVAVKPSVIIEVHYEEIQKSPTYNSGFALRFPRFIRLREDRGPRDIDNLETIKRLFSKQRHRNSSQ